MFLLTDVWIAGAAPTSLSLLEFLDSQEKGLVSFLPIGAGAGLAATTVVVTTDLMLLTGDEGAGVVTLLLVREVVLLSWSFSEGLLGSEGTISNV